MHVCVIGTGYVGLVSGACLAKLGHLVTCVDVDAEKVARLREKHIPIYEEGLADLVNEYYPDSLRFTTELQEGLANAEVVINAVGTPSDPDGKVNIQYVQIVAQQVGAALDHKILFVNKSTVPVGTADQVTAIIKENLSNDVEFEVASNPEFLREGVAVSDFLNPDRIVVGVSSQWADELLRKLYQPLIDQGVSFVSTDVRSAELIKYAANCFLATKIAFVNEVAMLAESVGANIKEVVRGVGLDKRIGSHFLQPGPGFGGSCFPKDVSGLIHRAHECGIDLKTLEAVSDANQYHRLMPVRKTMEALGSIQGKTIAVWGLAFKPNSDDIRESSSLFVIQTLLNEGAYVKAYDPMAISNFQNVLTHNGLSYTESKEAAIKDADALILMTHWAEFINTDPKEIKTALKGTVIIDSRNVWQSQPFRDAGLRYSGFGVI